MFYDPYNRYSSEYERQQLNILRAARGITPPIPPPRRVPDLFENVFFMFVFGVICIVVFFVLAMVMAVPEDGVQSWPLSEIPDFVEGLFIIGAPLWLFFRLWRVRWAMLEAEYQRTLERWRDAGCP